MAHATQIQLESQMADELGILQVVTERARSPIRSGRNHVVTLHDTFELVSAHGRYLCFVHEAIGNFTSLFQDGRKLPVPLAKDIAKQILQALDFLHG
jgi:serine/threonine protein kinase